MNVASIPSDYAYESDIIDRFLDGFTDDTTTGNLEFDLLFPSPPLLPIDHEQEQVVDQTIETKQRNKPKVARKQTTSPTKEALRKKRWRETLSEERKEKIKKREREQKRRRFHCLSEEGRAEHRLKDRIRKARERKLETIEQKRIRLNRERQRKAMLRAKRKTKSEKRKKETAIEWSVVEGGGLEDYNSNAMKSIEVESTWVGGELGSDGIGYYGEEECDQESIAFSRLFEALD